MIEDQTELEIGSENAAFCSSMERNARQQQQIILLRQREAERVGDWRLANQLGTALKYQQSQEQKWAQGKNDIETWIYSGPTGRVLLDCPDVPDV